jgi:PAS domain S-box-containing protein
MKTLKNLPRTISVIAGAYLVLGGVISFLGWALDIHRLTDWFVNDVSIQPNAAICVTLSGLAVLMLTAARRKLGAALGLLVALIAGAALTEWITGGDFGINTIAMFGREWGREGVLVPGRMGPPGSLCWTLIGTSLFLTAFAGTRRAATRLAVVTMGISLLSITGYVYGASVLFTMPRLTTIALQTATFIAAASIGLTAVQPDRAPMRWLVDEGAVGIIARRAVPCMFIVPIALGWLRLQGELLGLYDTPFAIAVLTLALTAVLGALLWWTLSTIKRSEVALRESEQRLYLALSSSGAVPWGWDTVQNRLDEWTSAYRELYGFTRETPGTLDAWLERIHPEDRRRISERLSEMTKTSGDDEWNEEFRILHPVRGERWIGGRGRCVRDDEGRIIRMAGVNLDITERKQAQETLERALAQRTAEVTRAERAMATQKRMAAVGTLASGIAHDINNIAMPLGIRMEYLLRNSEIEDGIKNEISVVGTLLDHLRKMSKNLSLFSRDPDQEGVVGSTELSSWWAGVEGLIAASLFGREDERPGAVRIQLHGDIPAGLPAVNVSPHRLTQAVLNLVHNARDAIRARGLECEPYDNEVKAHPSRITIEARAHDNGRAVTLKVIDDGCGMSPDVLFRAIEPFFTTKDRSSTAASSGTGLGLSLVHAICESAGGSLEIQSELNKGTAITLTFPLAQSESSHVASSN